MKTKWRDASCLQLKLLTELNKKIDELSSTGVWNWAHVQPQSSNWVDLISRLSYCWHVYFFHQLPLFISWCLDLVSKSGCFFTWRWEHIILHRIISVVYLTNFLSEIRSLSNHDDETQFRILSVKPIRSFSAFDHWWSLTVQIRAVMDGE